MKKFEMLGRSLGKSEQKLIVGGLYANACTSCTRICYYTTAGGGEWGYGNCNQQGSIGAPSICDNYCCADANNAYWCNA